MRNVYTRKGEGNRCSPAIPRGRRRRKRVNSLILMQNECLHVASRSVIHLPLLPTCHCGHSGGSAGEGALLRRTEVTCLGCTDGDIIWINATPPETPGSWHRALNVLSPCTDTRPWPNLDPWDGVHVRSTHCTPYCTPSVQRVSPWFSHRTDYGHDIWWR
jgi:hypothetical protein